jgi:predicted Zn-dependent peptidase
MTQRLQGTFYISAQLPAENLPTVEAAIAQHIQTIQQPVQRRKLPVSVRKWQIDSFLAMKHQAIALVCMGYYQSMLGDLEPAFNYPATIQALNAADLQAAAQQYLSPTAYGVIALKPA